MGADYSTFITNLTTVEGMSPLANQIKNFSDGVHCATPLLSYLAKNAKVPFNGAEWIHFRIEHARKTGQQYWGSKKLSIVGHEFEKSLILPRGTWINTITFDDTDEAINAGPDRLANLVQRKIENVRKSMGEDLELQLFGNGTSMADGTAFTDTTHRVVGLQNQVGDTAASMSWAGVTRTTSTAYWNNQIYDASSGSITTKMLATMMTRCAVGGGEVDLITTDLPTWLRLWSLFRAENYPMVANKQATDLGWPQNFDFMGAAIVPNYVVTTTGGIVSADLGKVYFLNTKSAIKWYVDPNRDMKISEPRQVTDQETVVQTIKFHGQLVVVDPRSCGVLHTYVNT